MSSSGELEDVLVAWLRRVATVERPPSSVIAFNIGLFETEGRIHRVPRRCGALRRPDDGSWACDEAFCSNGALCDAPDLAAAESDLAEGAGLGGMRRGARIHRVPRRREHLPREGTSGHRGF